MINGPTSARVFEKSSYPEEKPRTDLERARRATSFGTTLVSKKVLLLLLLPILVLLLLQYFWLDGPTSSRFFEKSSYP